MAAHADKAGFTLLFQFLRQVKQSSRVKNAFVIFPSVHKMEHEHINIVSLQPGQEVIKERLAFGVVP